MQTQSSSPAAAQANSISTPQTPRSPPATASQWPCAPALATPDTFLVSEAVRGEGAVLLDAHGRRFMQLVHPDAELAPRDVVARGIARQMAMQNGKPVLLDATGLVATRGADFLATRFPTIDAAVRSRGFDWSTQPIPVTPAAHYWMGGVRTDIWGCTSVPGLYAVGEVACTGVHGANRLASNSLLESLVFAWRCAAFINEGKQHSGLLQQDREPTILQLDQPSTIATTPLDRITLQTLMWNAAGIERNGKSLEAAAAQLRGFHTTGETIAELETANLLALARVLVPAALARQESRGAHFRDDYPETSDEFRHSLLYLNSAATLSKSEVPC